MTKQNISVFRKNIFEKIREQRAAGDRRSKIRGSRNAGSKNATVGFEGKQVGFLHKLIRNTGMQA